MLDCLIIGDSIAKGVSDIRKDCAAYVQSGISSRKWNDRYLHKDLTANTVVISLGSNDSNKTFQELLALRQMVDAGKVSWIMPANHSEARDAVVIIARNFNDTVFEIPEVAKDRVHPTVKGYRQLAEMTKK